MDKNEIGDIISAAEKYLKKLENLNENIKTAEKQITESGNESLSNIETIFDNLKENVIKAIESRKLQLINNVKKVQNDGIKPLKECQNIISDKINKTNHLISDGNSLKKSSLPNNDNFYSEANFIGNLPAVPSLTEVPYINFIYLNNTEEEIIELCRNVGVLFYQSPVNINALIPKPGGILVQWEENDSIDEKLSNITEFRLQFAFGDFHNPINFHDCYIGPNMEYLKKDLKLNQDYSFRVCCKIDGLWGPWSLPQICQTTIKPFCWESNQSFVLNNDNKLATKMTKEPALILSSGPQVQPEYSVEFTILEIDSDLSCIGLCDDIDAKFLKTNNIYDINSFVLSSNGSIRINSKEKSTKLPSLKKGSKVSFTCEEVNDKVRIYVESEEKNVTYDWKINNNEKIYFFAFSQCENFKVLVE